MGRDARFNLGSRPKQVRDCFNRVLAEGDGVILNTSTPQVFQVRTITPVLDPSLPASGFVDIMLTAQVKFRAPADQANQEFVRVIAKAETQPPAEELPPPGEEQAESPPDPPAPPRLHLARSDGTDGA